MSHVRYDKVMRTTADMGELDLCGETSGDVLVIGWGGTFGALRQAAKLMRADGHDVSHVHLRHLFPLNPRLDDVIKGFKHVLVAELNMGQLRTVLRDRYLLDIQGLNKIQGKPFKVSEITEAVQELLGDCARAVARASNQ